MKFVSALLTVIYLTCAPTAPGFADGIRAVTSDLSPYSMSDPARPGFTVELVREMAKKGGVPLTIEFLPWARALEDVASRPDTIIFTLVWTAQRDKDLLLFQKVLDSKISFVTTQRRITDFSELKPSDRIGTSPFSPQERDLRARGIAISELNEDQNALAKMLDAERISVWYTHPTRAIYLWRQNGFDPAKLIIASPNASEDLVIGANRSTNPKLITGLQEGFRLCVEDGTYERIFRSYFEGIPVPAIIRK